MRTKITLALLVLLVCAFAALSCGGSDVTDTTAPPAAPAPDTEYLGIECDSVFEVKPERFGFEEDRLTVSLLLPDGWVAEESEGGYLLTCDGETVGSLTVGESETQESVLESALDEGEGASCAWSLLSRGADVAAAERYSHRFVYTYSSDGTERTLTLTVDYARIDGMARDRMSAAPTLESRMSDTHLGALGLNRNDVINKGILVLGGDAMRSSNLDGALKAMSQDIAWNIFDVVSSPSGCVCNNWLRYDRDFTKSIRSGDYAAVIFGGFCHQSDVAAFKKLADACVESNTKMIILPSHNESYGKAAAETYPDAYYLDWKGELDALVALGVAHSELCSNHSAYNAKPLSAYVGAHMIHRAVFGEMPPSFSSTSPFEVNTATAKAKLGGEYVETGRLKVIPDSEIRFLSES